jgi:hypothetical protein
MSPRTLVPAVLAVATLFAGPAFAHGIAGDRLFVSTLLIDDPNVADEATVSQFQWMHLGQQDGNGAPSQNLYSDYFEFDKTITENFGFAVDNQYNWLHTDGAKSQSGLGDWALTLKYKPYVNAEHEFMMSLGVIREFGRSGSAAFSGTTSSTTPTIYWGKGLGDLPIGYFRPFAVTGTFGYQFADQRYNLDTGAGATSLWVGGLSLQYSLLYLQTQVKDLGLPEVLNKVTPLVEVAWSSPGNRPNDGSQTQYLIGAGAVYTSTTYALSIEALFPGNKATGTNVGVVAQVHLYFDDLLPHSLGTPIVNWFGAK